MEQFLNNIINECVEYLNQKGIPYTLNDTTITVNETEYKFYIEDNTIYMNNNPDRPQLGSYLPYLFKYTIEENVDRIVQLSEVMKYNPVFLQQDKIRLNNENTEIICIDKGYNKLNYIEYIYNLTSQYPYWEFTFIIEEERFIFQYGFYKEIVPVIQDGMGKLDYEHLDAVIDHLKKTHIKEENE